MTKMPHHLRIFLASPGDVADERAIALRVIEDLQYDPLLRGKLSLEVVAWDKRGAATPLLAVMTPQEAINTGLPLPAECDIVIVIFWARMGTPLPSEYAKADGSRYLSGTEWEYQNAVEAARHPADKSSSRPQVIIYRRTEKVLFDIDDPHFEEKRDQYRRVQEFFEQFTAPDGSILQSYNAYVTPDDFRVALENHLKIIIDRLLKTSTDSANKAPMRDAADLESVNNKWIGSPFPGLRSFGSNDASIFFGRGRETDQLLNLLRQNNFVAVVGASGSGKSSLVKAGLLPRLSANAIEGSKDWVTASFMPGDVSGDPFMSLIEALQRYDRFPKEIRNRARDLQDQPALFNQMCEFILADKPPWSELILFIDQFEEIFTLIAERYRSAFINMLIQATKLPRLRLIVALRADFYSAAVMWPELADLLRNGTYPLATPTQSALYEMITKPADRAGLKFEDGLPERILADTGDDSGALALMAYLLDELYIQRDDNALMSFEAYAKLGGVQGAIGIRAQQIFESLSSEIQAALPSVFRELVEVDERGTATRKRARLDQITGGDVAVPAAQLVLALTEARLLVQSRGSDNYPEVEVAHEALLRSWPLLASWIGAVQEDLFLLRGVRQAAQEWESRGRNTAYLWPHERLLLVYDMVKRLGPALDESEIQFIRPEVQRILDELQNHEVTPYRRATFGERISVLGDARTGVGLRPDGLPEISWCEVPRGETCVVSEINHIDSFYMARYPITYSQYQSFLLASDGYGNEMWWSRLSSHIPTPQEPSIKFDNHPRSHINWYEAAAFCQWLTAKLSSEALPAGTNMIRLPTEAEWQLAASLESSQYPWGDSWAPYYSNTRENGLGRLVAVGMYPKGISPSGIFDLSGNVWEWTLTNFDSGKNELSGSDERIIRGGSWRESHLGTRSISRRWKDPDYRADDIGFRPVAVRNT